jgi:hypothetical protein
VPVRGTIALVDIPFFSADCRLAAAIEMPRSRKPPSSESGQCWPNTMHRAHGLTP